MPKLVFISDTHNKHASLVLPDGDILIHAGDATGRGTLPEISSFLTWFEAQPHSHKIFIAGNHDLMFEQDPDMFNMLLKEHPSIVYLEDSGVEVMGLKFWGTPWVSWCGNWAFCANSAERYQAWMLIPDDIDILITHSPSYKILDKCKNGDFAGCDFLKEQVLERIKPKIHCHGHIHESYGRQEIDNTLILNASQLNENYQITNPPHVIDI
jgi:Icc-related predicted phosphoesterase